MPPERTVLKRTLLENTTPPSNKFYEVTLNQYSDDNVHYEVVCRWGKRTNTRGRRGSWKTEGGQTQVKWDDYSRYSADTIYRDLVRSKMARGYKEVKIPDPKSVTKSTKTTTKKKRQAKDPSLERFSGIEF